MSKPDSQEILHIHRTHILIGSLRPSPTYTLETAIQLNSHLSTTTHLSHLNISVWQSHQYGGQKTDQFCCPKTDQITNNGKLGTRYKSTPYQVEALKVNLSIPNKQRTPNVRGCLIDLMGYCPVVTKDTGDPKDRGYAR